MSEETKTTEEVTKTEEVTTKSDNLKWYIVASSAGKENTVSKLLKQRVKVNDLEDQITEIVVPTQERIIVHRGKKKTVEEKIFPGYILLKMELNDSTLHLIRNTEGVQGFVGMAANSRKPSPLSEKEVKSILAFTEIKQEPTFQAQFNVGDAVKILDGPFKEFVGSVQSINEAKGQVRVLLTLFERDTPVDFDFMQVNRISNVN